MTLTFQLLVGNIASGKSTYATQLIADDATYMLVCPDLIREQVTGDMSDQTANGYIFQTLVPQHIRAAARMRMNIVYDATCYNRKNRKGIIALARELGYRVVARVFRTPFEECVRRNDQRDRVVPISVLERMRDGWQEPELTEGIDEIQVVEWTPPNSSANPLDSPPQSADTQPL